MDAASTPVVADRSARRRIGLWMIAVAVPLALFAILLWRPAIDRIWESHPAHFWLVLVAAAASFALGWAISSAGRRRRDARLFLISLACLSSAGFLGLHALATPGVLLGKNAGFELATPVGLVLSSAFAAISALELRGEAATRVLRCRSRSCRRSTARWRASSWTAGRPRSRRRASRSSRSPRPATCASTAGAARGS